MQGWRPRPVSVREESRVAAPAGSTRMPGSARRLRPPAKPSLSVRNVLGFQAAHRVAELGGRGLGVLRMMRRLLKDDEESAQGDNAAAADGRRGEPKVKRHICP
ncbi:hypothetical protein THAOC_24384 [Thalassiosira oceanica]|uniref:Uncharacterized protein n=1 Tax=Thalassiosira oceanica TaxID=159749 RepID=K0S4H8_THAOC|nr:hypothetical protein THAOC_24384 [Thalassiosira oceanica]|eukprot:EJK55836.1 hypothetical protein THAOC_24384 [Thalassiosira oceanica]